MKKFRVLAVVGTRPQLLKVSRVWADVIVNTGQHYDRNMNDVHSPNVEYNLHLTELGETITKLIEVMEKEKPLYVVVIGDTRSTLAGAVAAAYCGINICHLEAGMRSYEKNSIEERIRVTVDRMSDLWLCANEDCRENLKVEGFYDNVINVGDPEFDKLFEYMPTTKPMWKKHTEEPFNLLTLHRAELVDNKKKLQTVLEAIGSIGQKFIFPIHPRTKDRIEKFGLDIPENIGLIDPVDHKTMANYILNANKVVTDSGGVQREAYWLLKDLIIVRDVTEHVGILRNKCGILTGYDKDKIIDAILNFKRTGVPEIPDGYTHERVKSIFEEIERLPNACK